MCFFLYFKQGSACSEDVTGSGAKHNKICKRRGEREEHRLKEALHLGVSAGDPAPAINACFYGDRRRLCLLVVHTHMVGCDNDYREGLQLKSAIDTVQHQLIITKGFQRSRGRTVKRWAAKGLRQIASAS